LVVYDRKAGTVLRRPLGVPEGFEFWRVAISPGGRYVALGSDEGLLHIFDVANSDGVTEVARLRHDSSVVHVAFSDDGKHVATISTIPMRSINEIYVRRLRVWRFRPKDLLAEVEPRMRSLGVTGQ
jgi:WD40 repeat protein